MFSIFVALLFIRFADVRNVLLGQEILYSCISKTVSFLIWVPLVPELQHIFWIVCKVQFDDKFTFYISLIRNSVYSSSHNMSPHPREHRMHLHDKIDTCMRLLQVPRRRIWRQHILTKGTWVNCSDPKIIHSLVHGIRDETGNWLLPPPSMTFNVLATAD